MSKPQTLQELKSELASLEAQLKGMSQLAKRRTRIAALIRYWEDIFEDDKKPAKSRPTAVPTKPRQGTTTSYAELAIVAEGPMPIALLVEEMRRLGWVGSGEDATDRRRVYTALYARGKSTKFRLNDGKWEVLAQQAKAS